MDILIKSAKIIDSRSSLNGTVTDILICDGLVKKIAKNISEESATIIDAKNKCISVGWIDICAQFCDPGEEYKEDILSGLNAAAAGGFTGVVLSSASYPAVQTKAQIEYLMSKSKENQVSVFPKGALTLNREGKEITEMYDMKLAGAVAFSDDKKSIEDSGLLMRSLMYAKNIGVPVFTFAEDKNISNKSIVNESANTTLLGFKGQPSIAEEIIISRNISIAEYVNTSVHFSCVSSAGSVALIREAKKKGLKVTCDVAVSHLILNDSMLNTFDTNLKTKPPLRSVSDMNSLIEGIIDGTIDAVCSDHTPQEIETKDVEFDFASFGMIGLETAYGILNTVLFDKLHAEKIIELFTTNPCNIIGLSMSEFKENSKACFTIFNPEENWKYDIATTKSKSHNSPFNGWEFKGKPFCIVNNNSFKMC